MSFIASMLRRSSPSPAQIAIPEGRMERVNQASRRRLSDVIEDVFERACIENDLRSAAGLYAILEDMHKRQAGVRGTHQRGLGGDTLVKAQDMLMRCRTLTMRDQGKDGRGS